MPPSGTEAIESSGFVGAGCDAPNTLAQNDVFFGASVMTRGGEVHLAPACNAKSYGPGLLIPLQRPDTSRPFTHATVLSDVPMRVILRTTGSWTSSPIR